MLLEPVFPSLPTEARSLYISPNLPAGSASPRREIEQGLAWLGTKMTQEDVGIVFLSWDCACVFG